MVKRRIPDHLRLAFWDFVAEVAEGRQRSWTETEHEYLRQHYATTPTKKIAAALGRTVDAIIARTNYMGIYKAGRRNRGNATLQAGEHSQGAAQG